ncbi:MAG: ligase-associated DNA damage response endonuclease PdeM [Pseudomonadota bacterium]
MNKTLTFASEVFVADASGALYWPREKTLLVADLHFEKASHFAARGYPLPPYDSFETLQRLADVLERYPAETLITLGDSWHDMAGPERMHQADAQQLTELASRIRVIWISGNHDPKPTAFGVHQDRYECAGFQFVHEATQSAIQPTFCGHYHPKIRMRRRRASKSLACFAVYEHICVLPAFGAYTGGLDITHPALTEPLGIPHTAYACGKRKVYELPLRFELEQL